MHSETNDFSPDPSFLSIILNHYKLEKEDAAMICIPDQVTILAYTSWRSKGRGKTSKFTFESFHNALVKSDVSELQEISGWSDLQRLLIQWTANPEFSHNIDVVTKIWKREQEKRLKSKDIRLRAYEKQIHAITHVYQYRMAVLWAIQIEREPGKAEHYLRRSDCYLNSFGKNVRDLFLALPETFET